MNYTVKTYRLYASNGRYIRRAVQVTDEQGRCIEFLDMLTKSEAIRQAKAQWKKEDKGSK